ncbi:MarR family winged helix-turn-helix transcriptional regulator [Pigmentiphaga sp. YJ18]|uniref:MarR family winged helix-turn-helix transcriptional regulator n=1 Tax=Pigmentiphaga sp. YJ18 TaxID=3134907 RepID=UPI003117BB93
MKDQISSLGGASRPETVTVSRRELLVNRSDSTFRKTIHTLMAISNNIDALRIGYGELIGISGPQHELIMVIARVNDGQGIGVGELARLIRKSSPFVVMETNQLQKQGLIEKIPSSEDRRRVVLRVTRQGEERLAELAPYQREINDILFGDFSREEFLDFFERLGQLLPSSERAVEIVESFVRERQRQEMFVAASRPARAPARAGRGQPRKSASAK